MRLQNSTWPKIKDYFKENDIVILGLGSCECHGTHLPLGTDFIVADKIIDLVEQKKPNILITPTIPYGSSNYFSEFPGTISIGTECLYNVLMKVINSLFEAGARKFIIINGHGGNIPAIEMAGYEIGKKGALMSILNWWIMAKDLNSSWNGGHAGGLETAAIMYINPEIVDWKAIRDSNYKDLSTNIKATGLKTVEFNGVEVTVPRNVSDATDNGWIGPDHPNQASEDWGKDMLENISEYIAEFINEFNSVELKYRK